MNKLTKQQLAFILDIKVEEARAKMCVAWCKQEGIENKAYLNIKNKIDDPYPLAMSIEILATNLNLLTLQQSVDDICHNYLNRPASKKWILCDYPEKFLKKCEESGKKKPIPIPGALKTMLPAKTQQDIKLEWQKRYPKAIF